MTAAVIVGVLFAAIVVAVLWLANRWAESSIQRNGFMTEAEFTAEETRWLAKHGIEA